MGMLGLEKKQKKIAKELTDKINNLTENHDSTKDRVKELENNQQEMIHKLNYMTKYI